MKIVKANAQPQILISMPVFALAEAGINPTDVVEIYAEGEKVIIRKFHPDDDYVCDGDCANCPFGEVECAEDDE